MVESAASFAKEWVTLQGGVEEGRGRSSTMRIFFYRWKTRGNLCFLAGGKITALSALPGAGEGWDCSNNHDQKKRLPSYRRSGLRSAAPLLPRRRLVPSLSSATTPILSSSPPPPDQASSVLIDKAPPNSPGLSSFWFVHGQSEMMEFPKSSSSEFISNGLVSPSSCINPEDIRKLISGFCLLERVEPSSLVDRDLSS